MSLFVIADLHLSLASDKPMDIFGGWNNYVERLERNWQNVVRPEDTVVIPGDISWAMDLEEALEDFKFISKLNGNKIILKGNHDYWWSTKTKADRFLAENGIKNISFLHNNHYRYEEFGICGTRGWINDGSEPADAKVIAREAGRLSLSIQGAIDEGLIPVVFLHYPPVYAEVENPDILEVLKRYDVKLCFYGHLHGRSHGLAINGDKYGINFRLISSDYLQFMPLNVTEIVHNSKK
ncbi:MAG: metallophosphoesterase [Oscillospiraceae bacterium]|nr:metallophosphoesterase [Oscillospiraceae bacterium]